MSMGPRLTLSGLSRIPLIKPGDDLGALLIQAIDAAGLVPENGDILVVAQKIVSKSQGRYVDLSAVVPSARAIQIASETGKSAALVEVVISQSRRIVRTHQDVLIVEHADGYIVANAGVDRSNVEPIAGTERVLLLPVDSDAQAEQLRSRLTEHYSRPISVIINDSFGRPWRRGTVGVALGAAGVCALKDLRGQPDLYGRPLQVTEIAYADEVAAAASLLMGQASEGIPAVLVSGLPPSGPNVPAQALIRPASEDLFR